ncbi:DUF126 domain-containing protein [Rhizobium sp. TRM95111]|uniref:aconitase X swivel domain-containing protein n=1 Tax=Rhizobium alarense TaxID=2846851 RepID=UPI001F399CE7|nr:DUF126 domain-containing protein [Rhizobium alarense]MCF3642241.1 DUF126 domain-containing protein [Rhizobium alarense]
MVLVPGSASGAVLTLDEPLSFWGGLDSATGSIIDRWHPQYSASVRGCILLMPAGRGSSSGSSVLAEAIRLGTGPAGIVLLVGDPIVAVGAMIAAELYGTACPVLVAERDDWSALVGESGLVLTTPEGVGEIRGKG